MLRLRDGDNPALWAKKRLGKQRIVKGHHAAVPLAAIPGLVGRLGEDKGTANTAFRLLIFTGMRSGEILGLRWSEVDFEARLLNLPGARMKAGVAFRVPLSDHAATILSEMPHTNELVFPGRSGKRLSAPIFERILKRLEMPGTPHGIRSAFAGWAAERGTALEVIDASLAHRIGTAVTRAYVRGLFKLSFAQIAGKTKVRASSGGCWLFSSNATNVKPETSYRASSASSKSTAHPKTQIGKPSSTRNGADLSQQLAVRGGELRGLPRCSSNLSETL